MTLLNCLGLLDRSSAGTIRCEEKEIAQARGASRPAQRCGRLAYFPHLLEWLGGLADQGLNVNQIAEQLNAEGLRPPKRTKRNFVPTMPPAGSGDVDAS
ncbi:hypothetical protein ACIQNK_32650 [Streptomyces sp. NPDC091273]|uniref:hypothetical protein n=1 Tax=Streptomyces sp. NPDC091273 TaxID=3365982 RepID=UPI003815B44E